MVTLKKNRTGTGGIRCVDQATERILNVVRNVTEGVNDITREYEFGRVEPIKKCVDPVG